MFRSCRRRRLSFFSSNATIDNNRYGTIFYGSIQYLNLNRIQMRFDYFVTKLVQFLLQIDLCLPFFYDARFRLSKWRCHLCVCIVYCEIVLQMEKEKGKCNCQNQTSITTESEEYFSIRFDRVETIPLQIHFPFNWKPFSVCDKTFFVAAVVSIFIAICSYTL